MNEENNDQTATLDGPVYIAYEGPSDAAAGFGVYIGGTSDSLTVDALVQGGGSAGNGSGAFIDVGPLGALQGLGSTSWGLGIDGTGAATNDTALNLGTITGTTGIGVSNAGGET